MKIVIEAAAFYVLVFVASYLLMAIGYKDLRSRLIVQRVVDRHREKMGTMDKILIIEAVAIVLYIILDFYVFWHVGAEPTALTAGFFAVCGGENGVMAWIRVQKQEERMRKWQLEDEERMAKNYSEGDDVS